MDCKYDWKSCVLQSFFVWICNICNFSALKCSANCLYIVQTIEVVVGLDQESENRFNIKVNAWIYEKRISEQVKKMCQKCQKIQLTVYKMFINISLAVYTNEIIIIKIANKLLNYMLK